MRAAGSHRLKFFDRLLLAVFLPVFAIVFAVQIREGLSNGIWQFQFVLAGAADDESYPIVDSVIDDRASIPELEPGDILLRAGEIDLRGVTSRGAVSRAHRAAAGGARVTLLVERGSQRFETWIERIPQPLWWGGIPFSLGMVGVATLLLVRAPQWQAARAFFVGGSSWGIAWASQFGMLALETQVSVIVFVLSLSLSLGTIIFAFLHFNESLLPLRPWQRLIPLLAGGELLIGLIASRWLPPLVAGRSNRSFQGLALAVGLVIGLACLARAYRRSEALERRQLKWIWYGVFLGVMPIVIVNAIEALGGPTPREDVQMIAPTFVPIGFAVAILGFRLFDIDRLISATASVTILGVGVVGAALALVPRVAHGLATTIGVDADVGRWALSVGVVALLVPAYGWLRPWLDRQLFAEQAARMLGFEMLLTELSVCGNAAELTVLAGERLDTLLAPVSIATYAREGDRFTPIFVRGQMAAVAFPVDSVLVRSLEARTTPLAASDEALDAFDRAALMTLGAELVVPARRAGALAAFTCLGHKRSGDIYTATDRAVLSAVAHKISERLAQLDAEVLSRDTHAMQERLRRYVPGAVAAEVEAGRDLEPEAREVSVLFVDLRGYTSFAEGREAQEIFSTINAHTERVSRIVKSFGGTVVEFNGDGMMAVFGAPDALANKERAAVQAGREIVEGMPGNLRVGVGIATGEAMVGSLRSADRWIWSAIGNTTNLAARLQTITRELGAAIAIDAATHRAAGYVCGDFARHENLAIRGLSERLDVFVLPAAPG